MKCVFVYKEDYPWDVRVEKITKSLVAAGFDLTIVAQNRSQNLECEFLEGIAIRRLPSTKKWPVFVQKMVNLAVWFNPFWIRCIANAIPRDQEATLVIVRDLPLVSSVLLISKFRNIRVILDMAECYPEMFASTAMFRRRTLGERILKSPALARIYESYAVRKVDHTFVMIEESRDRLLAMGLQKNKVSIVSNTPLPINIREEIKRHDGSDLRLVYVGFLTRIRGIDSMVRAVRRAIDIDSNCSIQFDIIGVGASREEIINLRDQLELQGAVTIHGWLQHEQVASLVRGANVGALTYRVCGHWNHTIPNKIFDYMAAGLPVLATEVLPIKRILENADCGIVVGDGDIEGIADGLVRLQDAELRERLGENGRQAVLNKYNWDVDEDVLVAVANRLLQADLNVN